MERDAAGGLLARGTDVAILVQIVVGSHLGVLLLRGTPPDEAARSRTAALLASVSAP